MGPGPRIAREALEDRVFAPVAAAEVAVYSPDYPTWYFARIAPGGSLPVPLDEVAAPGTVQSLFLWGVGGLPGGMRLEADYRGRRLERHGEGMFRWDVPDVVPGQPLTLRDVAVPAAATPSDATEDRGASWVHGAFWQGPVTSLPSTGVVRWETIEREPWSLLRGKDIARRLHVARFRGASLSSTINPTSLPRPYVEADPDSADRAYVWDGDPTSRGSNVIASLEVRDVEPTSISRRPSPEESARGAEHVIVATQATLAGAKRLAEHRTKTGLRSVAVAATDVYDAYADGEQIRRRFARSSGS